MRDIDQPFDVTKAVDFTDQQIASTWVDLPEEGFSKLVDPRSPMPLLILGGKGSGRTHLMRYYSYALQKMRSPTDAVPKQLEAEGYVGIFMRCEGLNAGRFQGKGQGEEAWAAIFSYYMDLWLAELVVRTLDDAFRGSDTLALVEPQIVHETVALFDDAPSIDEPTLASLSSTLAALRREVDVAVNNAALTRKLGGLLIRATRGRLVFGIPTIFVKNLAPLKNAQIVYFVDELENLTVAQQCHLNTLIREKVPPCTFKVGSRLFGFRTRKTFSAGEENRQGSEYSQVLLDEELRSHPKYGDFARRLVLKRLQEARYVAEDATLDNVGAKRLDELFEYLPSADFECAHTSFVHDNYPDPSERPWLVKLRRQLGQRGDTPTQYDKAAICSLVATLACEKYPLLEKVNIFLFYQDWAGGQELLAAAEAIKKSCDLFISGKESRRHGHVMSHFKGDLLAQLLREGRQKQRYLGLDAFIDMLVWYSTTSVVGTEICTPLVTIPWRKAIHGQAY